MTTILVDSSVILDVATRDPHWFAWSSAMLGEYACRRNQHAAADP